MNGNPTATKLLGWARAAAIAAFDGAPATVTVLEDFARRVRDEVLAQADRGQWNEFGITDRLGLLKLKVEALVVSSLVGGQRIELDYDFSATAIPALVTRRAAPRTVGAPGN